MVKSNNNNSQKPVAQRAIARRSVVQPQAVQQPAVQPQAAQQPAVQPQAAQQPAVQPQAAQLGQITRIDIFAPENSHLLQQLGNAAAADRRRADRNERNANRNGCFSSRQWRAYDSRHGRK